MSLSANEAIAELNYEADHINVMIGRHMLQVATLECEIRDYEKRLKKIKAKLIELRTEK